MKCYLIVKYGCLTHIHGVCHLKSKSMRIINFSNRSDISKWQKKSVLLKNVFDVIHFYMSFPQYTIKVHYMRVACLLCEIQVVHNIQT